MVKMFTRFDEVVNNNLQLEIEKDELKTLLEKKQAEIN